MQIKSNIALIGFWATGKTILGRELSKKLNTDFIDIDKIIEEKTKKSIFEIFRKLGEKKFRDMETVEIRKISSVKNSVISCGAGVILRDVNMKILKKNSIIVWLDTKDKIIFERIKKDNNFRIFEPGELKVNKIRKFLKIRIPLYEKYCDFKIDTYNKTANECVYEIIEKIKNRKFTV